MQKLLRDELKSAECELKSAECEMGYNSSQKQSNRNYAVLQRMVVILK